MTEERRILVVDDIAMFRELERLSLSRFGEVVEAESGEEAVQRMGQQEFDVVVLDWRLPDMRGAELVPLLKEQQPGVPLVAISSEGAPEEHEAAVRAGADDVLSKPLARGTLVAAVGRFLRQNGIYGLPRAELNSPICVKTGEAPIRGRLGNISRGGLFIETENPPEVDTELSLNFQLPEETEALASTGQVVWRRVIDRAGVPPGVGVRFLALASHAAERLDRFVYERAPVTHEKEV